MNIATIISFSTNEASFLRQCLEEVEHFSKQTLVIVFDHFFNGEEENIELLQNIYAFHSQIQFVQCSYSPKNFYGQHPPYFWHSLNRLVGTYFIEPEMDYVFFLDADEIIEERRFCHWVKTFPIEEYDAMRFACYWYFRKEYFRANEVEEGPLLIRKKALDHELLMHPEERGGIFSSFQGRKKNFVKDEKHIPMVHHYSWVRSKELLLKKVRAWGHCNDRNWEELIEKEFSKPFSGRDFVHGYQFTKVRPYLKTHAYSNRLQKTKNVIYLSTRELHKMDLTLKFGLKFD